MRGQRRKMHRADMDRVLARGARLPNGSTARRSAVLPTANRSVLQVLRDAARRSERHPSARAPARTARQPRVRGLVEPRRLARHQQPRHARGPAGQAVHPSLHVRFRIDHGQRQHGGAGAAGRQRIHPRVGAGDAQDARDAGLVRAAVDQGGLPERGAIGGAVRSRVLRSRALAAGVSRTPRSTTCGPTMRSGRQAWSRGFPTK